jgi:predicted Zn-dependent peptidase
MSLLRSAALVLAAACVSLSARAADRWQVPVHSKQLANGLTVIVSPDASSPTVGVSVIYKVGMRLEPKNRTGFAHLFEHLMFQGTPNAPKGVFDKAITTAIVQSGSELGTNQTSAAKLQATLMIFAEAEACRKSWPKNLTSRKTRKLPVPGPKNPS